MWSRMASKKIQKGKPEGLSKMQKRELRSTKTKGRRKSVSYENKSHQKINDQVKKDDFAAEHILKSHLGNASANCGVKSPIVAVDFFCGAGGVTRGLLDAGIDVIAGIDFDQSVEQTYLFNNTRPCGDTPRFLKLDLSKTSPVELAPLLSLPKRRKVLFASCPPCRPFSKINKEKGKSRKERNLLLKFVEFVEFFKPDFVFAENVPGVASDKNGRIGKKFIKSLKSIGYQVSARLADAKRFGVPQNRSRFIFLAGLSVDPGFPTETHGKQTYVSVRETIGDRVKYPKIRAGEAHSTVINHRSAFLSPMNLTRIEKTPKDGGGRESWSSCRELELKCYKNHTGHTDVYGRIRWDAPSPALTTRFNSLSNGRFGHPDDDRALSLREGASIQTFPYDYVFYGSMVQICKQIGNAVPRLLVEIFGRHIASLFSENGSARNSKT